MSKTKRKRTLGIVHCALCIAFAAVSAIADTDICGNEIRTFTEDGVTKTYQFIVSGDPRPNGEAATPAPTQTLASNEDGLVALFKSVFASIGGALRSIPWLGTTITFK